MKDADVEVLWTIFSFIRAQWTGSTSRMPQAQFNQVVAWQIQLDARYAGYYALAVDRYRVLLAKYRDSTLALYVLFRENQLPSPLLPDVANYVLLEFMRWNVAFGGFAAFNYENYVGWMGGGSYLTIPPPYRALPQERSEAGRAAPSVTSEPGMQGGEA